MSIVSLAGVALRRSWIHFWLRNVTHEHGTVAARVALRVTTLPRIL